MGINLHIFAERHVLEGWELADPMVPNPKRLWSGYQRGGRDKEIERELEEWPLIPADLVNDTQNALSEALHGNWHERFAVPLAPVAAPRGLPEDLSPVLRDWFQFTGSELLPHDHPLLPTITGWLSLEEVLDYDWDQIVVMTGNVDPEPPRHRPLRRIVRSRFVEEDLPRLAALADPEKLRLVWWH